MKSSPKPTNLNSPVPYQRISFISLGLGIIALLLNVSIFQQWLFEAKDGEIKNTHGWNNGDEAAWKKFGISFCDFDRISISDITTKEFEHQYRLRKPLILTFHNGAKDWINSSMWSRTALKEQYGQWLLLVGNAREIVRHGGNGHVQTSVKEFLDDNMQKSNVQTEPLYAFDRYFYRDSDLPASIKLPKILKFK
ncbi:hypothetical protein Ahia01_001210200, partial [Argonauta hians]